MRLENIVIHNLRRRKGRAIFLTIGLLIGVATVVTLLSLTDAMGRRAQHEMENFGANIIISPRSDQLALNYGGIQLGGVSGLSQHLGNSFLDVRQVDHAFAQHRACHLLKLRIGYPTREEEKLILERMAGRSVPDVNHVLTPEQLRELSLRIRKPVAED